MEIRTGRASAWCFTVFGLGGLIFIVTKLSEDPKTIHWLLWEPKGGGERVKEILDQYLRPAISA